VFLAVAVVPLVLAGLGGHLATLALPENGTIRRRWKIAIWAIALVGVGLFGLSQIMAYHADTDRQNKDDEFRNTVLSSLGNLAKEPSKTKREADVKALEATINATPRLGVPTNPVTPPPIRTTQEPTTSSLPSPNPANVSPVPSSSQPVTQPDENAPVVCPPPGIIRSKEWRLLDTRNVPPSMHFDPFQFDSQIALEGISLHPFLRSRIHSPQPKLDEAHIKDAQILFTEIQSRFAKPKSLSSNEGIISISETAFSVQRSFVRNTGSILVVFNRASNGEGMENRSEDIPMSSFSSRGNSIIASFDALSKQLTDGVCEAALRQYAKH